MEHPSMVAAVILAAGLGRRFGGPKAGATLVGRTFLAHVAATARRAGLDPVIAVIGEGTAVPPGVRAAVNPDPGRGLSSSLQVGLQAVPASSAAVVLLVDQPTVSWDSIAAVLAARGTHPIVAVAAEGRLAPPVLLEPGAFPLVMGLSGDIGLREVFRSSPELVRAVPVPAHAPDIDTRADLARLEAEATARLGP